MDPCENWASAALTNWLTHIGINHIADMVKSEENAQSGLIPPPVDSNHMDSLDVYYPGPPFCLLEQRGYLYERGSYGEIELCHEHFPLNTEETDATEEDKELLFNHPPQDIIGTPTFEMRGSEEVATGNVLQRLIREHLRYGNPNENMNLLAIQQQAAGSAGPSNDIGSAHSSTENLVQEDPQMVHQSARQEPQGQEHQVDNSVMEKQARLALAQQNVDELPTYEEAKALSQFFRGQQQATVAPGIYVAGVASQKTRTEGRPTVNRVSSGQVHKDEALKELKQGHVRSLSERLMQLSLERSGVKSHPAASNNKITSQQSNKTFKNGGQPSPQTPTTGIDFRGPPPEYPFKARQMFPTLNQPHELGHFYSDTSSGILHELPKQYSGTLAIRQEATILRYQSPPEYGPARQCQVFCQPQPLQQHSPMSSQSTLERNQLQLAIIPPASPQPQPASVSNQQLSVDAVSIVARAQQMVEMLSEKNRALCQELDGFCEKTVKLQKFEMEIQRISEAHENLVKSSTKRETLDKAMRNKLEGEIRRLHDFNRDLRDRLETANRQIAYRMYDDAEDDMTKENHYTTQNKEYLKEKEKLEMELATTHSTNEDQRKHIEILEQALNSAQAKVVKLDEELRKKQMYVDRVERLQQALAQLQAACEKREQMERRLRTRLERELESLRVQQRHGGPLMANVPEYNAPALMESLREKEERILALEADMTKWEQKYLEEKAMRHFATDAAATAAAQRDTTIINHSPNSSYNDNSLDAQSWKEEEERIQSNQRHQDTEHRLAEITGFGCISNRIKNLHAQLIEKDAMIKVLQQRSRKEVGKLEAGSLRPGRSFPSTHGLHSRQTSLSNSQIVDGKKEENRWTGSAGMLTAKDGQENILSAPLQATVLSIPVVSTHSKTGSKDNSTQTDKSPELIRPSSAPIHGRRRLNTTPVGSPVVRPKSARSCTERTDTSIMLTRSYDKKGRSGYFSYKPNLDGDVVEILI